MYHKFNNKGIKKIEYCTMKNSTDICKIEKISQGGEKYFKFPTLSELYLNLFQEIPKNTHNSFVDVLLCLRCYLKINNDIDVFNENETFREMMHDNNVVNV